jgi:hypothetical protein
LMLSAGINVDSEGSEDGDEDVSDLEEEEEDDYVDNKSEDF